MSDLQIFNNPNFGNVRFLVVKGKGYAVGNDVAAMLEYARPYEAVSAHCKGAVTYRVLTNGGEQEVKIIPEGDIYRLIVKAADQSKNPEIRAKADQIERWIFDEVLPSIRKHGMYAKDELLDNPDLLLDVVTKLRQERTERLRLQAENTLMRPKAEFFDAVADSKDAIDIGSAAKVLNMGIGRNTLFERLRNKRVLMSDNQPYQRYVDLGYFRTIEQKYTKPDGSTHISVKTLVYQKGLHFIRSLLKKSA
jgi:anti-repressor protein